MSSQQFANGTVEGIDKMTDIIKQLLDAAWGSDWGTFAQEFGTGNDPNDMLMPYIIYNLFHRVRSHSIKSIKPRHFESIPDPDNPGYMIQVYRQWFDCLLDFNFYHKTNREAEILKRNFEDFMIDYTGYLKEQGVSEIIFLSERSPEVSMQGHQDIPHRILRYLVRIERIHLVRSVTIQKITASIGVLSPGTQGTADQAVIETLIPQAKNGLYPGLSTEAQNFLGLYSELENPIPTKA